MRKTDKLPIVLTLIASGLTVTAPAVADWPSGRNGGDEEQGRKDTSVQLGPRPFHLIRGMDESPLKSQLLRCQDGPFHRTDFSIAHRGAALQFPEHTRESYEAGARWIRNEPRYGRQAVYLDDIDPSANPPIPRLTAAELRRIRAQGVRIFAPPVPALLAMNGSDEIVPSQYALDIRAASLGIITWTFERADLRRGAAGAGFYYAFDPEGRAVKKDSDMYHALDVLARDVRIRGIFSDWPATVTYYANCMGLE